MSYKNKEALWGKLSQGDILYLNTTFIVWKQTLWQFLDKEVLHVLSMKYSLFIKSIKNNAVFLLLWIKINILFGFSKHLQAQILFYPQTWKHSEPVCPCGGALAFLSAQFETVYINMLSWFENMSSADALWVTSTLHDRLPTDAT